MVENSFQLSGQIVNIIERKIYSATVSVKNGRIASIVPCENVPKDTFILPGFIDAHVHIESSMLVPSEFARLSVVHGTVAAVSDPHEIANVLGIEGVRYMIENAKRVPFHIFFGAPSCVPATSFETAGATLSARDIEELFEEDNLHYLSEMMNYPGVIHQDPLVMEKIAIAKKFAKPIDGHAPGLRGEEIKRYIEAGISTDHECFLLEEAEEKIRLGMKILIREGSAARNWKALHPLIKSHPDRVMFCSDDKHPHELVEGHINQLVQRSIAKGYDIMDVLRAASYAPIKHYGLDVGLLREGDSADFIIAGNLKNFPIKAAYVRGIKVAENGKSNISSLKTSKINHFNCNLLSKEDFAIEAQTGKLRVINAIDGQLITHQIIIDPTIEKGFFVADPKKDLLKIVVVNRYRNAPPAIAFIHGFGLRKGAIASCIAHDSHNMIAVGTNDEDICSALNTLIENQGGISIAWEGKTEALALPVGGIMSDGDGYSIARSYLSLDAQAKRLGSNLEAPFMALSFMTLLVIPSLKLSDKGLFDANRFSFVPIII